MSTEPEPKDPETKFYFALGQESAHLRIGDRAKDWFLNHMCEQITSTLWRSFLKEVMLEEGK